MPLQNFKRRDLILGGSAAITVMVLAHKLHLPRPKRRIPGLTSEPQFPVPLSKKSVTGNWPETPLFGVHLDRFNARDLSFTWDLLEYKWTDPPAILPIFLRALPSDMEQLSVTDRKQMFFMAVTPHVLYANHIILLQRQRLLDISGRTPTEADRVFLDVLAERMRLKSDPDLFVQLLDHIDVIPPSLALAQGAAESGWGTSRFAREGNALFGVWTWDQTKGIAPLGREPGKTHSVKRYDHLFATVTDYMDNLNRHAAYADLRASRSQARVKGQTPSGAQMVGGLLYYSERRMKYVEELKAIMRANNLALLDTASLTSDYTPPTLV